MNLDNEQMLCLLDDEFQDILKEDEVLDELEKQKYNPQTAYFELMMAISKVFTIDGTVVSCITPAIWAYLYAIDSPYTKGEKVTELDTDIFLYILHNGLEHLESDFIEKASGFCRSHGINPDTAEGDVKTLVYLSFRPLEMFPKIKTEQEKQRFDLDWLTHLVSIVCPLTGKTSDEVIYDMSLTECFYYKVQSARQYDIKGEIKRRNSDEINAEIYARTMELGRQYWESKYKGK